MFLLYYILRGFYLLLAGNMLLSIMSRFHVLFLRRRRSTPSRLMGAGDLDLSTRFPFVFGDFLAGRIPEPDKTWKFDVRRDLGIYLGDADDTKRGYLVYMVQ